MKYIKIIAKCFAVALLICLAVAGAAIIALAVLQTALFGH